MREKPEGKVAARCEGLRVCQSEETGFYLDEGKSPRQCLKEGHCSALKYAFFECRRSMLDNRARFRGRKGY
ncbi:PREDICTED: cytochrome c oxidase assembly factor 5 [Mandrillus leucophaeus]|uniref:cytochrome c oxidase assembly factor 5 n=1 Tax=Mandrillus leucophaeus TaxID=9568 RepID=UPI0005F462A0|nr:PREDICTED: cytochrome c oxidase assembly factor 5 [Mandrillus leucophaeus]